MADKSRALLDSPGAPITSDWLSKIGFKWHRLERQPYRHWLLWLGDTCRSCTEDLGIELAPNDYREREWFCWLRSDASGRYHRFIHIRHLNKRAELLELIRGLTGQTFYPDHAMHGRFLLPEQAMRLRAEYDRIDMRMMRENPKWYANEADETKGRPLVEHMNAADEALAAKEAK